MERVAPSTFVLKVNINCSGCEKGIKKVLQKIPGVRPDSTVIDAEQGRVTVSGCVDPQTVIRELRKAGKIAELLVEHNPQAPPAANDRKLQIVPWSELDVAKPWGQVVVVDPFRLLANNVVQFLNDIERLKEVEVTPNGIRMSFYDRPSGGNRNDTSRGSGGGCTSRSSGGDITSIRSGRGGTSSMRTSINNSGGSTTSIRTSTRSGGGGTSSICTSISNSGGSTTSTRSGGGGTTSIRSGGGGTTSIRTSISNGGGITTSTRNGGGTIVVDPVRLVANNVVQFLNDIERLKEVEVTPNGIRMSLYDHPSGGNRNNTSRGSGGGCTSRGSGGDITSIRSGRGGTSSMRTSINNSGGSTTSIRSGGGGGTTSTRSGGGGTTSIRTSISNGGGITTSTRNGGDSTTSTRSGGGGTTSIRSGSGGGTTSIRSGSGGGTTSIRSGISRLFME